MYTTRLMTLIALSVFAQGVLANTIWLKDRQGNVCYNSASTNPGQVIGYGGVNRDGTGFTLTISNPANGTKTPATGDCTTIPSAPAANPIGFSGSMTARLQATHMWKPGTNQVPECLDQGTNLSGLSGTLNSGQYRLLLSTQFTDGCNIQTQTKITSNGLPAYVRTVTLFGGGGERPLYNGVYHIFNVASVPEPSSILLILAGATGLGALAISRRKSARRKQ